MLAVIAGHTLPVSLLAFTEIIYWWHVPFFFLLSGFLYKRADPWKSASRRARQLLLPYAAWLSLIVLHSVILRPGSIKDYIIPALEGGTRLPWAAIPLWFLPVLFVSLIVYSFVDRLDKAGANVVALAMYLVAHVWGKLRFGVHLPLNLEVVLIAVPYLRLGVLARTYDWPARKGWCNAAIAVFAVAAVVRLSGVSLQRVDLLLGFFGRPLIDVVLALAGASLAVAVSQAIANFRPLANLGRRTIVILGLQSPMILLLYRLTHGRDWALVAAITLVGCYAIAAVIDRFAWARSIFNGETSTARVPSADERTFLDFPGIEIDPRREAA